MIEELLRLYEESQLNPGQPKCLFNPTLIFNEGWLLRALLRQWKLAPGKSRFAFLPFPAKATVYSEGQLYTAFPRRQRRDEQAETHTHVDGIVGHFSIGRTKSGIELDTDGSYVAVFEAKLYSKIDTETSHSPGYDQVSRTVACVINSLLSAGWPEPFSAHVVVLYPTDNARIDPTCYSKTYLEAKIAARVQDYDGLSDTSPFARGWRAALETVQLSLITWEEALAETGDGQLMRFYELCQRFNRRLELS